MITSATRITIGPQTVEYRDVLGTGIRLVKVWYNSKTPRIISQMEYFSSEGHEVKPMSLFLDEILAYIQDGRERLDPGGP
jgi:hypothetical protein